MALAAVLLTIVIALAGCSSTSRPSATSTSLATKNSYELPDSIRYVDHWVSTPAVELMSADGTFIRAFAEAAEAAVFNIDGKKGTYPGFTNADRTGDRTGGGGGDWYGYATRWVIGFTAAPDGSATADICEASSITEDKIVHEDVLRHRLSYRRSGDAPPDNQEGPARAPAQSVFGEWQADEYSSVVPITKESLEPCLSSMPAMDKTNVENAPGWPAAPK